MTKPKLYIVGHETYLGARSSELFIQIMLARSTSLEEIDMNSIVLASAREFCTKNEVKSGWTQEQHVALEATLIIETLGVESKDDKVALLDILSAMVNPSAFRQSLEKQGILTKGEDRVKAIANRYLNL